MPTSIERIANELRARAGTTGRATYTCRDGLDVVFIQVAGQCILTLSKPVSPVEDESIFRWREAIGVPRALKPVDKNGVVEFRWPSAGDAAVRIPGVSPS